MTYDFRPDGLHIVARWPVLARITARHTDAPVLTTRDMASLYLHAPTGDWWMMGEGEKAFCGWGNRSDGSNARIALEALPPEAAGHTQPAAAKAPVAALRSRWHRLVTPRRRRP